MANVGQALWNLFHKKQINELKESVRVGDVFRGADSREWTVTGIFPSGVALEWSSDWCLAYYPTVWGELARYKVRVDPAESVEQAMKVMK